MIATVKSVKELSENSMRILNKNNFWEVERMAGGCILGECPVCTELMWEDEDLEHIGGYMLHAQCASTEHRIKALEAIVKALKNEC